MKINNIKTRVYEDGTKVQTVTFERPVADRVENLIKKSMMKYEDISNKLYEKFGIIV